MEDASALEQKIKELEARIIALEDKAHSNSNNPDALWFDQLYTQAKKLVTTHQKASAFFLQRKLIIDSKRAGTLLQKLESEHIIGPKEVTGQHKVLVLPKSNI